MMQSRNLTRAALVILAHNEAEVIGPTVGTVIRALTPGDAVFVVADQCSDDTAERAQQAGATVFVRRGDSPNGKGEALSWFIRNQGDRLRTYALAIVLDADSVIEEDFVAKIKARITENQRVFQCLVLPIFDNSAPIAQLAALSELLDQQISDGIRSKLKWPVRLRGTGMVFATETLAQVGDRLQTKVEDVALSLLLIASGAHIWRMEDVVVHDPKPGKAGLAARQRARWFRGQWSALRRYAPEVARILFQGPAGWSLLGSLFLKPRWLALTVNLLLVLLLARLPWLALIFGVIFLLGFLYAVVGIFLIPTARPSARCLLYIPAYIWMWLRGILLSFRRSPWLRARE